jgi:hypothetical protein
MVGAHSNHSVPPSSDPCRAAQGVARIGEQNVAKTKDPRRERLGRTRRTRFSVLNIIAQPHPSGVYNHLFSVLGTTVQPVSFWGALKAWLSVTGGEGPGGTITGMVKRYSELDSSQDWYDEKNDGPANPEQVEQIKEITKDLKPHFKQAFFMFDPKTHHAFVETTHLSAKLHRAIFEKTLQMAAGGKTTIKVRVVGDRQGLNEILQMPQLSQLDIDITTRANADDLSEERQEFFRRMEEQKAEEETVTLRAIQGESLAPDNETKMLARIALNHGTVTGRGRDEHGASAVRSTEKHPARILVLHEGKTRKSLIEALWEAGSEWWKNHDLEEDE